MRRVSFRSNTPHPDCQLPPEKDIFEPYIRGKYPLNKLYRTALWLFLASGSDRRTHRLLNSRSALRKDQVNQLSYCQFSIHPYSLFRFGWDCFMLLVFSVNIVIVPYFQLLILYKKYDLLASILAIILVMDFIGFLRIIINFCTGFYCKKQNKVILSRNDICRNYLKRGFLLDLVVSIPFYAYFLLPISNLTLDNNNVLILSLIILIKVPIIYSFIRCFNLVGEALEIKTNIKRCLRGLVLILLVTHWVACLNYFFETVEALIVADNDMKVFPTWVVEKGIQNDSLGLVYYHCFFRSVSLVFKVSIDWMPLSSDTYMLWICFSCVVGRLLAVFLLSEGFLISKTWRTSQKRHKQMMFHLAEFMSNKQLPDPLRNKIFNHFKFNFQRSFFEQGQILNTMTRKIREDIVMHSCLRLVEKVKFFRKLPLVIMVKLAAKLHHQIYLTNDVIIRAGEPGYSMYFVSTGTVAIYTPTGVEMCHITDGNHFGEIALIMEDVNRTATVKAVETCELYELHLNDFRKAVEPFPDLIVLICFRKVEPFPDLIHQIKETAQERIKNTSMVDAEHRRILGQQKMSQKKLYKVESKK
uniref:Cyclic nucleotide-binding domain-containing protein n=1 Tax=Timema genevievae TaxID=629358 RepID=A0A7R9PME4_TIMGE|nr:unnamed protein product [Timema genevievae]